MSIINISLLLFYSVLVLGNNLMPIQDKEEIEIRLIHEIIMSGRTMNDWKNILCAGKLSDKFYKSLQKISPTIVMSSADKEDVEIEDLVPYTPHTTVIGCTDFDDFETIFIRTKASPYWHPLSNLILLYQNTMTKHIIGKLFFILWYYKACNAIIVQLDESTELIHIHTYSPYISDNFKLQNSFGCWTAKSINKPLSNFREGFVCVEQCHNVTRKPSLQTNNLGTCIGYDVHEIRYNDTESLRNLVIFEDKGKNLHGFALRAYATEVKPFLVIDVHDNATSLSARDGMIWNCISKAMNFTIDLSPSASVLKEPYHFERSIQQIYAFAHRKVELFLLPIYQFALIIVDVDYTFPTKESGLCLMSHRAGFETTLFDFKLMIEKYELVILTLFCFLSIWFAFFLFSFVEKNTTSLNQVGKDLSNAFRTILSISPYKAPKSRPFRIFLGTSIWCFFVLNFFTQAAIISFFSSFKRGKEVNTFEDVIEKGYIIEGQASPDAMLPDDDERFKKLSSKFVAIQSWFECSERMTNDSHRFCLIDCAIGHYMVRNLLNNKGEQYLHIAERDRFHSHYLNMIISKHSPLTKQYNKLALYIFEAGLVKKWEEYKYNDIKEEALIKPLGMDGLFGIFNCFGLGLGICLFVFAVELAAGNAYRAKQCCKIKYLNWKRTQIAKKKIRIERKMGKIIQVHSTTQTD